MAGSRGEEWRSVLDTAPRDMSNPEYRKYLEKQQALEGSYPEMVVAPLMRPVAQGAKVVGSELRSLGQTVERPTWPTTFNHVVGGENIQPFQEGVKKGISLRGRNPTKPEDITHAYRNLSPAELANARETGYLLPNPAAHFSKDGKWFSAGDEAGIFGRTWKDAPTNSTIRIPIQQVPKTKAVRYDDVEILDKLSGKYGKPHK